MSSLLTVCREKMTQVVFALTRGGTEVSPRVLCVAAHGGRVGYVCVYEPCSV